MDKGIKDFRDAFFEVIPVPEKSSKDLGLFIRIKYALKYRNVTQNDGTVCSFIPIINQYYYAKNEVESDALAALFFKTWIDGWMRDEGFSAFIRHLKIIGFEPSGGVLDWNMLKKKLINRPVIFKPFKATISIPEDFGGIEVQERRISQQYEMAY